VGADAFGVQGFLGQATRDGRLHTVHGMLAQKLQNTDEMPWPGGLAVAMFQGLPQVREARGELPITQHRRVIQGRRPSAQRRQVVQRIEDLRVAAIAAFVTRHHVAAGDHLDTFQVAFDHHRLKGAGTRHAVTVAIETHGLILVHLGGLQDAGVERPGR